jgi:hypothetical protein
VPDKVYSLHLPHRLASILAVLIIKFFAEEYLAEKQKTLKLYGQLIGFFWQAV